MKTMKKYIISWSSAIGITLLAYNLLNTGDFINGCICMAVYFETIKMFKDDGKTK